MSKNKLNRNIRQEILSFLKKRINETTDYTDRDNFRETLRQNIVKFIEEKYPIKDMEILLKYETALADRCLIFITAIEWQYQTVSFYFTEKEKEDSIVPLVPRNGGCSNRKHISKEIFDAIEVLKDKNNMIEEQQKKRLAGFSAFVLNAKYFEEVEAVIPSISTIKGRLYTGCNVPTIISPDLMDAIKTDALQSS